MFNALELKIPPVPLAGVFIALAWLLATLLPALHVEWPWRGPVGAVLAATGVTIAIAGVISFRKARTTVNPLRPGEATTLVASGIYRWTRNPMYLGLLLLLAGCVWFLGNAAGLLLLPLFVAYMNRFQIGPEERALRQRFGEGFDVYQRSTRRWL
jgi:protein-S-isoprenylcysteine O-methyltransferase Ste14